MRLLISICMLVLAMPLFASKELSPVGKWTTYIENTETPESIVEIYWDKKHQVYNGKIVKSLTPFDPAAPTVCQNCKGRFAGKKIQGLEFLWGFVQSDDNPRVYQDGHVLDPRNGNEYNAKMTLKDGGDVLEFRGYMGISLFGGSRTWTRVK